MTKYVYLFPEGNKDQKDLLGGKGANLAEMTNLGLPVPPGFTITTEACNAYIAAGNKLPDGLMDQARAALAQRRGADRQALRRSRAAAARVRPLRREVLDARDDGHDPQPGAERDRRSRASSPPRTTRVSATTPGAASS